jgi:hypothetical protein
MVSKTAMRKFINYLSDCCTCYAKGERRTIKFEQRTLRVFTKACPSETSTIKPIDHLTLIDL